MFLILTNFRVFLGILGLFRAILGLGWDQKTVLGSIVVLLLTNFRFIIGFSGLLGFLGLYWAILGLG